MSRAPRATYRIQFGRSFGFRDAASVAGYLSSLGISHLYASPYLASASGTHGYDVVAHDRVDERLGDQEAHRAMCDALAQHGMAQVLDVVPNHMAISGRENAMWWDVLANGPASRFASFFDVEWEPPERRMRNTLLLPVLGDHYGRVLEAGELRLAREGRELVVRYHERAFPLSPRTIDVLLEQAAERCGVTELAALAEDLRRLPESSSCDAIDVQLRYRESTRLLGELQRVLCERPEVAPALDAVIEQINADPDALDALLERQNYRLAFWRAADRDLSYRRFFDIDTLIGVRVEDEEVFRRTHELVLRWVAEGSADGLRIDHVDGLRDPLGYLERLRAQAPDAWLLVEKILGHDERLPPSWPIDGTTGYDFVNRVGGLLIDPTAEAQLTKLYERFTGRLATFPEIVREKKHAALRELLGSDVNRLTALFLDVCERHRRHRDYTRHELHEVLREALTCMPVYRTYVRPERGEVSEEDVATVEGMIARAKANRPDLDPSAFDFLADVLLLRARGEPEAELTTRFQQLAAPTMAKGVEDTAFYAYNRFIALNEVGGEPLEFGVSLEDFHRAQAEAERLWPRAMLATSTHDTKRSADVRARLALLSEIPEDWAEAVERWSKLGEQYWTGATPDRNVEYLLYQTLVGAWPIETERLLPYLEKACREMKEQTSWTQVNAAYEESVRRFTEGLLGDAQLVADLERFVARLVEPGRSNSLAQELIKLTSPGVPDVYQGTELWDLSLVDPDNRRPVDFALRRRLLAELDHLSPEEIAARSDDGLPKLWLTRQALDVRRRLPEAFADDAAYRALWATGPRAQHVVAFARTERVLTVATRLPLKLAGSWEATCLELPAGRWRDALTGRTHDAGARPLEQLLAVFPVALLVAEEAT
ncbi:MAG: malto-oligosyltrehalose synthase [Thermodesulfobacteriota bacterium]